jgi:hypothetical protein
MPHGDADVSGFERGAVVDPVAGHRHHSAGVLQRLHDVHSMYRTHEIALFAR